MTAIQKGDFRNETERAEFADRILKFVREIRGRLSAETLADVLVTANPEEGAPCAPEEFAFGCAPFNEFDSHAFYEVAIQVDSQSLLQVENQYYVLQPGQIAIIDRKQVHRLGFARAAMMPATMIWLNVTGDMLRSGYTSYDANGSRKIWGCDLIFPGGFLISEILNELREVPLQRANVEAAVSALQFFLVQFERKFAFVDEAEEASWNEQIAAEIKHYIANHLSSTLRLQELADAVSISACHLSKVFKQATAQTITGYIQKVKMEKAIEYLFVDTLSISQIATLLGFYDQYHFSKAFKAYTGLAPTAYRRAMATQRGDAVE